MSGLYRISTEEIFPILNDKKQLLRKYCSILAGYSGKIRLTGPSDPEVLWNEHILDSCYAVPLLSNCRARILDLGSGGGLPGIVWAICLPELEVHLLDSIKKKCTALEEIVSELSLPNVRVICARSEELSSDSRENYDLVAARAVTATGILLEYFAPLVKVGGKALAFKGPGYLSEINELDGKWRALGFSKPKVETYSLNSSRHFFLLWDKIAVCSPAFPRRPGMAEKKPWWRCNFDHSCND